MQTAHKTGINSHANPIGNIFFGIALMLMAAACTPQKKEPRVLPITLDQPFSITGIADPGSQWWQAFGDEELQGVIETAFSENLDLKAAWARLDQAMAFSLQAQANRWPELNLQGSASSSETHGDNQPNNDDGSSFGLNLSASYEVDLWGRLRANRSAAALEQKASKEDLRTTGLAIAGEVTVAWCQIAKNRALLDILKRQQQSNRDYLKLIELRLQQGQASSVDYFQQQRQATSIQSQFPLVERDLILWEQKLNILLGREPSATPIITRSTLPDMPDLPDTGLPAALLQRRPDLLAAEFRLAAADQRITAAIANQFPTLSLTAQLDTQAIRTSDLFDSWLSNLAGNVLAPLLDGGKRRAEVKRTRAVASEQFYAWSHTVLKALGEVEEALVSEKHQALYQKSLAQENVFAQRTLVETRRRYEQGLSDYLPVLDAIVVLQNLEKTLLEAQHQHLESRIALYRALGGDWVVDHQNPSGKEIIK